MAGVVGSCRGSQPGVVVREAQFPKSEDYFFKPLNEHVPVYQRPFRIVQDVSSKKNRSHDGNRRVHVEDPHRTPEGTIANCLPSGRSATSSL